MPVLNANPEAAPGSTVENLFENLPLPAWVFDTRSLRFLEINGAAIRRYGFSRAEFLAMTILDIRPAADVPLLLEFLDLPLEQRQGRGTSWRHCGKDGSIFDMESEASPVLFEGREAMLVTVREVPAYRQTEKEVRDAAETFRALFDDAPVPYHELDRNGVVVRVNRAECEMWGLPQSEVIGRPIWELFSPDQREAVRAGVARHLRPGERFAPVERRYLHPDGVERTFLIHGRAIVGPHGEITGIRTAMLDLTESKKAERRIAFQAGLLDQVSDALVAVNESFRVVYWNRAAEHLFGRPAALVLGTDYAEAVEDAFDVQKRSEVRRELAEKGGIRKELICRNQNGERLIIDLSATALHDTSGRFSGAVGIHRDVTAKKKIEEQLRILSSAVEQSPVSIVIADLKGEILYSNPKVSEVTGYSREELLGQNSRIFKSGHTSSQEYQELWRTIPQGVWRGVFQNKRKNGESFWEEATIGPIRDESGAVTHYLAVKEDITERRAMEAALKFSEERFRVAAQNSGDVVYEWDPSTDRVEILGCRNVHLPRDENGEMINGSQFLGCIHESDQARVAAAVRRNLESGEPYQEEYRLVLPSGEVRQWTDTGSALRDASGRPYKFVGVAKDVTETRQAERANAELAAIVESAETAIFTRNLNYDTTSWNAGAERIFGYTAAEMIGEDLRIMLPPDRQDEMAVVNSKVHSGERVNHLETVRLRKDGTRVEVMMTVSPVLDRTGAVVGAAHLVWDIANFRALQRQLAQAQKLESVGRLAAGIAHEINTPIQYIGDNAEFLSGAFRDLTRVIQLDGPVIEALRRGPAPELAQALEDTLREVDAAYLCDEVPKAIGQLSEGVQQVARIVRAMKEFSHPGTADKVMLDINRAIESTILVSRNEWKYVAELITDLDPNLPLVPCLAGEFNQAILNLVVNSAHAIRDVVKDSGRKGEIRITTRTKENLVEIRVSDTGTGIPESIRSKIFDPFFTTKEVGQGTGQGLSIAHNVIVTKHHGTLSFETQCGVGTAFVVQLPSEPNGVA